MMPPGRQYDTDDTDDEDLMPGISYKKEEPEIMILFVDFHDFYNSC